MIRSLFAACLVLLCSHLVCHGQADAYFYGAWWDTRIDRVDVLTKQAGALNVFFYNGGPVIFNRSFSATNYGSLTGTWRMNSKGKVFFSYENSAGTLRVTGFGDANRIYGTVRSRDYRSKFQASRKAQPD